MSIDQLTIGSLIIVGAGVVISFLWHQATSLATPSFTRTHTSWSDQPHTAHRFQPRIQSPAPVDQPADGPPLSRLAWVTGDSASQAGPAAAYPLLAALDLARGPGCVPFATSPDADKLEREAKILTDRYWSEMVWLTGWVDHERLAVVCTELERQHAQHADTPVAKHIPPFFAM